MTLRTRIVLLCILFGIQGVMSLINGVFGLLGEASYGTYGRSFVDAGIMTYLVHAIYAWRNKWTYWIVVFFAGMAVVRFVFGTALFMYSGIAPTPGLIALIAITVAAYGVIPLLILFSKDVREAYLTKPQTE